MLLFFIFWSKFVFAWGDINVEISQSELLLGESLKLQIQLDTTTIQDWDISIGLEWIENFQIFSQSQGYNFESINGQAQSRLVYTLDLRAIQAGAFTLGPVKILGLEEEIIDDETFEIQVHDSLIPSKQEEEKEDMNTQDTSDIEQLKPDRSEKFPLIWFIGIVGICITLFYMFLQYALFPKNTKNNEHNLEKETISFDEEMIESFQKLEKKLGEISSQKFFRKYNILLRKMLLHYGVSDALTATLSEIKKHPDISDNAIFEVFKKSYNHEYSGKEKTLLTRKKYIEKAMNLLKK